MKLSASTSFAALLMSNSALAQDATEYKEQLCDKVQQCRLGSLLATDAPAFMQDFIVQTVDSQCFNIASSYEVQIVEADLETEAENCVNSMSDQSCQELLSAGGEPNTKQCNDFLVLAEDAGIDFTSIELK